MTLAGPRSVALLVLLGLGGGLAGDRVLAQATPERVFVWETVVQAKGEDALRWPTALAAASPEELAVADAYRPRLLIFAKRGDAWSMIDSIGLAAAPHAVAHDGRRYLVSLRDVAKVVAIEGERHQLRNVTLPSGTVPGALANVPGGGFLVHDAAGGRVLQLDAEGGVVGKTEVPGRVTGIASSPAGGFYAVYADTAELRLFGADGQLRERWTVPGESPVPAWPAGIAVDAGGRVIVADRHSGRLLLIDAAGRLAGTGSRQGWEPGLLRYPADLTRLGQDRLAVADQGNGRVQIFRRVSTGVAP